MLSPERSDRVLVPLSQRRAPEVVQAMREPEEEREQELAGRFFADDENLEGSML